MSVNFLFEHFKFHADIFIFTFVFPYLFVINCYLFIKNTFIKSAGVALNRPENKMLITEACI